MDRQSHNSSLRKAAADNSSEEQDDMSYYDEECSQSGQSCENFTESLNSDDEKNIDNSIDRQLLQSNKQIVYIPKKE